MSGMNVAFTKMHGCGNDFVVIDARLLDASMSDPGLTPARAAAIADRHTGVGCDQFIVLEPPPVGSRADAFMRIRNPDGQEAGACGNATRCVAALLHTQTGARDLLIATVAGDLFAEVLGDGTVQVDMGPPRLDWADVPLAAPMDTLRLPIADGPARDPAACSMGNPHATFVLDTLDGLDIEGIGHRIEHHPLFPERTNVGFAVVEAPGRLRLRVWERGAGLTQSCGSGACAAVVNAVRRGLTGRRCRVIADGGALDIDWREDGHVLMAGPAATSFSGSLDLTRFAA